MKFFRSHIARLYGCLILLAGVALHYAKPVDSKADHSAFTNWLESHLKTQDDDVLAQLQQLSAQNEDLDSVIRQASELVATHSDDFKLPVSEEDASKEDHYQLILKEWTSYQNSGSGMGKAVLIQHVKPQSVLQGDSYQTLAALSKDAVRSQDPGHSEDVRFDRPSESPFILSPLKSGISINAP